MSAVVLKFHSEASEELVDAEEWYFKKSPNAAAHFILSVRETTEKIVSNPKRFVFATKKYQSCSVEDFPYEVIFHHEGNLITIMAVAHAKRRPGYWKRRK